jgi:hypothetical protein
MKITITIERITPNTWEWRITSGGTVLAGGYCRTMKAARNDAGIVFSTLDIN